MQLLMFLAAHLKEQEKVLQEMDHIVRMMRQLGRPVPGGDGSSKAEFGLNCHDLSLENVFMDEHSHTCIMSHSHCSLVCCQPAHYP